MQLAGPPRGVFLDRALIPLDRSFTLKIEGMRVLIKLSGLFGIGAYLSFSAHAVDWDRTFLSETGYRSLMGVNAALIPGLTTDAFDREVITRHVATALKGNLVPIKQQYRLTEGP